MKKAWGLCLVLLFLAVPGQVEADELDLRIEAATEYTIKAAMSYTSGHIVEYEQETGIIVYTFATETGRPPIYFLSYEPWWYHQGLALVCFEGAELRVTEIRVITNLDDGSGFMLAQTPAAFIRKYANAGDGMGKWLTFTDCYIWDSEAEKWNKLAK